MDLCNVAMVWSGLSVMIFVLMGIGIRLIFSGRIGVIIELLKFTSRSSKVEVEEHRKHITVNFSIGHRGYKLMIPKVRKPSEKEIYIHWPDGRKEHTAHPPGIPFLVSPGMIGADRIEVAIPGLDQSQFHTDEAIPVL